MSIDAGHTSQTLIWSVMPNETDWLAWGAIVVIGLAFYLVMFIYAKFDRWAEHNAEGTPLAKTIPTLLGVALLYEIFPLDHFNILLPLSAISIAVMADWMRNNNGQVTIAKESVPNSAVSAAVDPVPERDIEEQSSTLEIDPESKESNNV